jgi:murein DD-endopeptidase MepM/ murein hydrolase activator NlpD
LTGRNAHIRLALASTFLFVAGVFANPSVQAQSTKDKLEDARARVDQLRAEATEAQLKYDVAYEKWVTTRGEIEETKDEIADAAGRLARLETQLEDVARDAYQMGALSTVDLLLSAESFSEFSDRMVFLDQMAQDDADVLIRVNVLAEELRREQEDLARLEAEQARAKAAADRLKGIVYSKLDEALALAEQLNEKWKDELAAAAAAAEAAAAAPPTGGSGSGSIGTVSGQALQACPAPGTSFTDTFGAPRSGGRTHAGVDMMGNYGMPIYAAQSGSVSHSSSSLGGNQAYVYAGNGDYTFYAHLQGYSGASGQVSAGTLIGYMGDTGNATGTPHLHFEYHPGGALVNPTPYVAAVC